MTKAFYNKWRPGTWDEVVGQEHVIQTLQNAIRADKVSHAYIFAGPRGTGKTTTARILAKAVNCESASPENRPDNTCSFCTDLDNTKFLDLIEIDAASNTSVEDIRELREKVNYAPSRGRFKVYIIDEVHMLSTAAFNALLKTLEEPPSHVIFILATTELHRIPATVLSRCQRYEFRRIPMGKIVDYLKDKSTAEGMKITDSAMMAIARYATGSMRDAISLLDQLSSFNAEITLELVQTILGTATSQSVVDLVDSVLQSNVAKGLQVLRASLDAGIDARQFSRQIVEHLRLLLQTKAGNSEQLEVTTEQKLIFGKQAPGFSLDELSQMIQLFNEAVNDSRASSQPGLLLELALTQSHSLNKKSASPTSQSDLATEPVAVKKQVKPAEVEVKNEPPEAARPQIDESMTGREMKTEESALPNPDSTNIVLRSWAEIGRAIKQVGKHQTSALLNSCKPILKNGIVILAFKSDLLKTKMETGDHLSITKSIIKQVCKIDIEVGCSVVNNEIHAMPESVDGSGMVGTAINHGGKIVHK